MLLYGKVPCCIKQATTCNFCMSVFLAMLKNVFSSLNYFSILLFELLYPSFLHTTILIKLFKYDNTFTQILKNMLFSPLGYSVLETEKWQVILDSRRGFEILERQCRNSKVTPLRTPPLPSHFTAASLSGGLAGRRQRSFPFYLGP